MSKDIRSQCREALRYTFMDFSCLFGSTSLSQVDTFVGAAEQRIHEVFDSFLATLARQYPARNARDIYQNFQLGWPQLSQPVESQDELKMSTEQS